MRRKPPFGTGLPHPGVIVTERPQSEVSAELIAQSWRPAPLAGVRAMESFYPAIGGALNFPDFFGGNLDALWDCLTDLTEPTALVWRQWQYFAAYQPRDWGKVFDLLIERSELEATAANPEFAIYLLLDLTVN